MKNLTSFCYYVFKLKGSNSERDGSGVLRDPPPSERRGRDLSGWALSRRTWSHDSRTALAISVFVLTAPENPEYLLRVPWLDHPLRGGGERRCIASSCWGCTLKGHRGPQPLFLFISCCAYRMLLCSPYFPGQSWSVVAKS